MAPAELLTGLTLEGGWKVEGVVAKRPNATGGHFSTGYLVVHPDGRKGFLKAMDYTAAFDNPQVDLATVLNALTKAYIFERDICLRCRDQGLRRVVHAIDHGTIQINPDKSLSKVQYLIFERADSDIRAYLDAQVSFDQAFAFRTLHHVAIGLEQFHSVNVAHQDLKKPFQK